jgi:ribose-phosphate pyrophosphokinase
MTSIIRNYTQQYLGPAMIKAGQGLRKAANRLTTYVIMELYRLHRPLAGYSLTGMLRQMRPDDFGRIANTTFIAAPGCEPSIKEFLAGTGYFPTTIELKQFRNGESYARINESVRDKTTVICQDFRTGNLNDKLVQTLLAIDAAKRADAKRVILITPDLPYINEAPGSCNYRIDYFKLVLNLLFKAANLDELRVGGVTVDRELSLMFLQDKVFSRNLAPYLVAQGQTLTGKKEQQGHNGLVFLVGKGYRHQADSIIHLLKKKYQLSGETADLGMILDGKTCKITCEDPGREDFTGKKVYVFQTANTGRINDDLMEALLLVYTAKKKGAKEVVLVMPHLPYNRQERKAKTREAISAKLVANALVEAAGVSQIIALDPHAPATQGFVDIPFQYITAFHQVTEFVKALIKGKMLKPDFVSASPDVGRGKIARKLGMAVIGPDADFAIVDKDRPQAGESDVAAVVGKVRGRDVVIFDDLVDSAGTLLNSARALKARGAERVYVAAIHGVFSPVNIKFRHKDGSENPAARAELETIQKFLIEQGKKFEEYLEIRPDGFTVNALVRLQADPNVTGVIFTDSLSVPEGNIVDRSKVVKLSIANVIASVCGRIIHGESLQGYQYEGQ